MRKAVLDGIAHVGVGGEPLPCSSYAGTASAPTGIGASVALCDVSSGIKLSLPSRQAPSLYRRESRSAAAATREDGDSDADEIMSDGEGQLDGPVVATDKIEDATLFGLPCDVTMFGRSVTSDMVLFELTAAGKIVVVDFRADLLPSVIMAGDTLDSVFGQPLFGGRDQPVVSVAIVWSAIKTGLDQEQAQVELRFSSQR